MQNIISKIKPSLFTAISNTLSLFKKNCNSVNLRAANRRQNIMFNVKTRHTVKNREWILRYGKHTVRKDYHIHIANLSMERALAFSEQELYRYSNLAQYMLQTT